MNMYNSKEYVELSSFEKDEINELRIRLLESQQEIVNLSANI